MPCYRPLTAFRGEDGGVSFGHHEAGARAVNQIQLPCGQCIGCRIERSRAWAIRCVHESQLHDRNCFITLTYNDENLPEDKGLHVEHWQLFAKRLRNYLKERDGKKYKGFRFFHCGEYGEENQRPHYHALLFGEDFHEDKVKWSKNKRGEHIYVSKLLEERWGKGFCTIGELTYESAAYCARYIMKKITGPMAQQAYTRTDPNTGETWRVKPEYVTMSRRPGIASTWWDKYKGEIFPADEVRHEAKKFRPPRYYDNKLDPTDLETVKDKRRQRIKQRQHELTPERLSTKEKHLQHQISEWKRRV